MILDQVYFICFFLFLLNAAADLQLRSHTMEFVLITFTFKFYVKMFALGGGKDRGYTGAPAYFIYSSCCHCCSKQEQHMSLILPAASAVSVSSLS